MKKTKTDYQKRYDKIKEMHEIQRMSYTEIGRIFGISRQRVEQIHKGKRPTVYNLSNYPYKKGGVIPIYYNGNKVWVKT